MFLSGTRDRFRLCWCYFFVDWHLFGRIHGHEQCFFILVFFSPPTHSCQQSREWCSDKLVHYLLTRRQHWAVREKTSSAHREVVWWSKQASNNKYKYPKIYSITVYKNSECIEQLKYSITPKPTSHTPKLVIWVYVELVSKKWNSPLEYCKRVMIVLPLLCDWSAHDLGSEALQ